MDAEVALLRCLADGKLHSGTDIARTLGISRAAVWKRMDKLHQCGVETEAVRGRGYRLERPVELLDGPVIRAGLSAGVRSGVARPEVLFSTPSTSAHLGSTERVHGRIVLAEFQSAGRGRRGNKWISPACSGICLSLGWRFDPAPASLMLLSLLCAAAAMRALRSCGVDDVAVKWPNDLMLGGRKLGGILVESRGQVTGPVDVVLGIGINVRLPPAALKAIDQPAADLSGPDRPDISRNRLAAELINALVTMLTACAKGEPARYMEEWRRHDSGRGRLARLRLPDREVRGRIVDIDQAGMLVMQVGNERRKFSSGELSLRIEP